MTPSSSAETAASPVSSVEESFDFCSRLAHSHYENFPVASCLLPRALRAPVAALYAFARTADDFADEPGREDSDRLAQLAGWRRRLKAASTGDHERHPVFWAVSEIIKTFDLPVHPFDRLITAFERDVTVHRFPAFADVLDYCSHSADPVGEVVLRLFRVTNPDSFRRSNAICTALQLANFWQDVTVDAHKDRIYAPLEDLAARGLSEAEYLHGPFTEAHRDLMEFQVRRTWDLFREGRPLCDAEDPVPRRWLRAVWLGGTRILEKIQKQKWNVWEGRPALTRGDGLPLLWRWLTWRP